MGTSVMFVDGSVGIVSKEELDEMFKNNLIVSFWRSSGLAIVGRDELRTRQDGEGSWRDRKSLRRPQKTLIVVPLQNDRAIQIGRHCKRLLGDG